METIVRICGRTVLVFCLAVVLVGFLACGSSQTPASTSTPSPSAPGNTAQSQTASINLVAKNMAFDQKTITVPAGASVSINFQNQDSVPHNFALYTDSSASKSIFVGQVITSSSITYQFKAPTTPGSYFFRCDIHPTIMTGTFVVQ
jgi:plastocyanin